MANTKISAFTAETDVANITGFAAYKTVSGTSTNVRISGSEIESTLNLDNFAVGTLAVGRGGTGATTFTANGVLIGNTASAISATAELADGELLIGNTGNAPAPATLTAGTGVTVTNGSGSITIANSAPDQTVVLNAGTGISTSGTYPNFTITNSAPNQATPAAGASGQLQYNNGSNAFAAVDTLVYSSKVLSVGKVGDSARSHLKIYGGDDGGGNDQDAYLTLYCSAGTHGVTIEGPDHTGGSNYTLKLPASLPNVANQILESNASGALSWVATPTDTDTSIYAADGILAGARIVTMDGNNLTFASTGGLFTIQKNLKVEGQSYGDITSVSNATVDWDNGNIQSITLPSGASTYTPSNPQAGATYILKIIQPSAGDGTITWGSSVKWPGATAPTLTASNAAVDVVTLIYDGTNYLATSVLNLS